MAISAAETSRPPGFADWMVAGAPLFWVILVLFFVAVAGYILWSIRKERRLTALIQKLSTETSTPGHAGPMDTREPGKG